ncbi:MAG: hypothetical protein ABWY26_10740 [Microbacterium sp.]
MRITIDIDNQDAAAAASERDEDFSATDTLDGGGFETAPSDGADQSSIAEATDAGGPPEWLVAEIAAAAAASEAAEGAGSEDAGPGPA